MLVARSNHEYEGELIGEGVSREVMIEMICFDLRELVDTQSVSGDNIMNVMYKYDRDCVDSGIMEQAIARIPTQDEVRELHDGVINDVTTQLHLMSPIMLSMLLMMAAEEELGDAFDPVSAAEAVRKTMEAVENGVLDGDE